MSLWLLIISVVLIIIILILIFISFMRLARSQAAIFDDLETNNAFSWGSFAALSAIISLALVIISIILYWYDKIHSTLIHVITFFAFFTSLLTAIFTYLSQSLMIDDLARSPMFWSFIIDIISSVLLLIVFILSFKHR